jgi:hypothetical protein
MSLFLRGLAQLRHRVPDLRIAKADVVFAGNGHLAMAKYTLNREVVTTPVESGGVWAARARSKDFARCAVAGACPALGRLVREATWDGDS